jgi:hypothetical protein
MKKFDIFLSLALAAVLALIVFGPTVNPVHAQAATATGVSIAAVTSVSQCPTPVANSGAAIICPVIGSGVEVSMNGGAYTVLGAGAQGPQGPAGPTGPTGATGPQGPAGSMPANCPAAVLSGTGGLTFGANCK